MDEASQSDIKEVTSLLRGKKVPVVGDDKQVSATAAFIDNAKIEYLARCFLKDEPSKASLYDLARVMFPDKFVMLREHFHCFESIIRFSTQVYFESLILLRVLYGPGTDRSASSNEDRGCDPAIASPSVILMKTRPQPFTLSTDRNDPASVSL
jgi:hypothetical protein